jgi:hypothetical protein
MLSATAAGLAGLLARGLPLGSVFFWPSRARAAVVLDPMDPTASFAIETAKSPPDAAIQRGPTLIVADPTATDLIILYAFEPAIAVGAVDLVVSFRILPGELRDGPDTGVRFVINDGAKAIYVCCVVLFGVKGIAIAAGNDFRSEGNYAAGTFVPVDWSSPSTADGYVSLRVRRTSDGTAQVVEVNGVAPEPRVELVRPIQPAPYRPRTGPTVEFGCMGLEANAVMEVVAFRVEPVGLPVSGELTFTRLRIRDSDGSDRLNLRADFRLGALSDGLDPVYEPVTVSLATPDGNFYSQTLNGFTVRGAAPRRRWTLTDAERERTGIEQLVIDEEPGRTGSLFLRDVAADLDDLDFASVTANITIGTGGHADELVGSADLVEKRPGSGRWRLRREP